MLDPRIYRAAFIPALFALVLAGFSLQEPPSGSSASLAPDAFLGRRALSGPGTGLQTMAAAYPRRRPGSAGDRAVAGLVADVFRQNGFEVGVRRFSATTVLGDRRLETVVGVRAGMSNRRIVLLAHRDSLHAPATADLSGTAALAELARVVQGRALRKTLVLVSTSGGSGGYAGAARFAASPGGPVDAVIVLGDLAGQRVHEPELVPWSDGLGVAPPALRRTVAAALALEAGRRPHESGVAGQFARMAFPLTASEQGPIAAHGLPAVLVSASGERGPGGEQTVSQDRLQGMGRAVLRSVSALDGRDAPVDAPSAALLFRSKLVPSWAVRLLVGALILPALLAAVDGFARARRRREPVSMWLAWALAGALPFAVAVVFALALELTGLLPPIAAAPSPPGAIPLDTAASAALASVGLVIVLGWFALRPLALAAIRREHDSSAPLDRASPGAAAAIALLAAGLVTAVWAFNPFAAAILLLPLHVALLVVAPEVHLRRWLAVVLVLISLVPALLVVLYFAGQLGLSAGELPWVALGLVVGGHVGLLGIAGWCLALGTLLGVLGIVAARDRPPAGEEPPRTRGPGSYAGPGSLGGTESALRR